MVVSYLFTMSTKYVAYLKVEELKALAWHHAKLAIGTANQGSYSIYCGGMKKQLLVAHHTSVIGLNQVELDDLGPIMIEWNRSRADAEQTLTALIDSANQEPLPPPEPQRPRKGRHQQQQSDQQRVLDGRQQRQALESPPPSHQRPQQADTELMDRRLHSATEAIQQMEALMRRMAATQEQRHSLQEREKRSEEIIIRDNEHDQQEDDITIANKRARTTASTISPASSPSTIPSLTSSSGVSFVTGPPPPMHSHPNSNSHDVNHYHNTGHTHHINNIHGANDGSERTSSSTRSAPSIEHCPYQLQHYIRFHPCISL